MGVYEQWNSINQRDIVYNGCLWTMEFSYISL